MNDLVGLPPFIEDFSLVLGDLVALPAHIKLLQDEMAARVGEQTHRGHIALTVFTVLALPDRLHAFLVIVMFVLGFSCGAGWLAFRRRY